MNAAERAQRRAELRERYRRRKAAELEADGEPELAAELLEGRCACGCGRPLDASTVRGYYVDVRHRQKAHRRRLERAAAAAGVPARLSLEALHAATPTRDRNDDAPARAKRPRKPRPGVTVYLPSVDVAGRVLAELRLVVDVEPATRDYLQAAVDALDAALERRRRRGA